MHKENNIEITDSFQNALEKMQNSSSHLFITGKAGTGKSTLLKLYCESSHNKFVVLAPTGVAALNIKGQTIHRFFGFKIDVTVQSILKKKVPPLSPQIYKAIDTIIIDEVSMLRADLLDCIDVFLKKFGPKINAPFGGVRMIFIGDLFQLPPVIKAAEKTIFDMLYDSPYFFDAHCIQNISLEYIELKKVYRQKEEKFIKLLNRIRYNTINYDELKLLNNRFIPSFDPKESNKKYIYLTSTNKQANSINDRFLKELDSKLYTSFAEINGDFEKEYIPNAKELNFKVGAQVMLLNNDSKNRWVNGSIATIKEVEYYGEESDENGICLELQQNNKEVWIYPYTWNVVQFQVDGNAIASNTVGTFRQYPFRLAWAVTIHKSQGKTFDYVVLDVGYGTFAPGQMYVGLSRCTSLEGLILKVRAEKRHILANSQVQNFIKRYHINKEQNA